jgi:glutamyl-tRNA synthetase
MAHDRDIRVRIAPSPTGYLHVGTARTALFNYLYAKGHDGRFILRIEDTDRERSEEQYTRNIYESLRALGLNWDEGPDIGGPFGPYAQSERLPLYREWADKLVASGQAYPCYHTQAELDVEREQARQEKRAYIYSGLCRDLQARRDLAEKPTDDGAARQPSLRFRIPDNRGTLTFSDCVRGEVAFDTALLGDFVILKSDGTPSYNFAVVVDDILMQISQVIRGEDHLSNTPRQILLYEAFGASPPEFAHVGMILAPDRTKLSKRHGAVAVSDYIRQGYLPEAFCNFLALLGWSPPDGEEIGALEHFSRQFELDRITHSPAIFELDKLNFINGRLIRTLPLPELLERARHYLEAFDLAQYPPEKLQVMLDAVREPLTTLGELPGAVDYFFGPSVVLDPQQIGDSLSGPEPAQVLDAFEKHFLPTADFSSPETVAASLKTWSQSLKPLKPRVIMGSVRLAVTGRMQGADLSKTLYILGPETLRHRVQAALPLTAGSVA